jgi:hypothetical protein
MAAVACSDRDADRPGLGRGRGGPSPNVPDLGTLRPFQSHHLIPTADAVGIDATKTYHVHGIALQVPISDLTRGHDYPTEVMSPGAVIGVWATASRRKSRIINGTNGKTRGHGPYQQVSRQGNPLFIEVTDGTSNENPNDSAYFPYLGTPNGGYRTKPGTSAPSAT